MKRVISIALILCSLKCISFYAQTIGMYSTVRVIHEAKPDEKANTDGEENYYFWPVGFGLDGSLEECGADRHYMNSVCIDRTIQLGWTEIVLDIEPSVSLIEDINDDMIHTLQRYSIDMESGDLYQESEPEERKELYYMGNLGIGQEAVEAGTEDFYLLAGWSLHIASISVA